MKLTDTFIRHVTANGKVQKHSDGGGLFLYVTPTGKKSWRLAYRFAGRQKLISLGPYPSVSLREAREKREDAKKLLREHIDPSEARRQAKEAAAEAAHNSFEDVAREWYAKYSTKWVPAYRKAVIRIMEENLFPHIGKRPINAITPRELLAVLRRVEERGVLTIAHKALRDTGRIFRYAVVTGRAEHDIAADLRGALAPTANGHHAAITEPAAVGELLRKIYAYEGNFFISRALRLAPLVFVRAKELIRAEWTEIDLEAAEWRIPAERMKMKQIHIVPLSRQALAIFRELHEKSGGGQFVFPGNRAGNDGPMYRGGPLRVLRQIGCATGEHTFHGFRSMASTLLNELGYNADWIERQLAHCERNGVRAAYNYAEYLPERRRMVQEYADYLDRLRFASDSAEAEKQADETKDISREMDTNVAIGKIDENAQITERDTGWSEAYREKLRAAGYDSMDILQAWYG
ncbi:MAG: integrase arm-type DNA-binding domain-containing protein [Desulfovibrio sp.]|uniref:tyrosine-type recombinase/integrase n=1 Tax=Desulfovibrio sp. TaxID=885 RepID=UPI0025C6C459|nr:integrase arm-type DNA-binding domain-containing protein [Desulfovibrio sp.]MBS6828728.1 integrase arm-type DNA-binding domain-containing protein [Desulfovibrio sp.]